MSDVKNVKCQLSNMLKCQNCQMSNVKCQKGQQCQISNVKCPKCQMSTVDNANKSTNIKCQMSKNVKWQMSKMSKCENCQMSNVKCQTCKMSHTRCQKCKMQNVTCQTFWHFAIVHFETINSKMSKKTYCAAHEVEYQTSQMSNVKKVKQLSNVKYQMSKNIRCQTMSQTSTQSNVKCQTCNMSNAKCQMSKM